VDIQKGGLIEKEQFCRWDIILVLCLFTFVVVLESLLAFYWFELSIFKQFNVIYDSDPILWSNYFSTGHSRGTTTHPLLAYYVSIPILIVNWIVSLFQFAEF